MMHSLADMILSSTRTCAEQCWYAREEVCRCSCGGTNHGCLLVNGAPMPGRTKRVKDDRFRLVAVLDRLKADNLARHLPGHYATQQVPKDCKWPEAQGATPWSMFLWVAASVTEDQATQEITAAELTIKAEDVDQHRNSIREDPSRESCDGTTHRWGVHTNPCPQPEAHQPVPHIEARIAAMRCYSCARHDHDFHSDYHCHCPQCTTKGAA